MKRFVEGADRGQWTLFPESLDDWVNEDNPVRVVDAFVDAVDPSCPPRLAVRPDYSGM
jgi:transposase